MLYPIKLQYENGVCTVTIDAVKLADAGYYKCIAENSSGKADSMCAVRVEGEPDSRKTQFFGKSAWIKNLNIIIYYSTAISQVFVDFLDFLFYTWHRYYFQQRKQ